MASGACWTIVEASKLSKFPRTGPASVVGEDSGAAVAVVVVAVELNRTAFKAVGRIALDRRIRTGAAAGRN